METSVEDRTNRNHQSTMERLGRRVVLIPAFAGMTVSHSALYGESINSINLY